MADRKLSQRETSSVVFFDNVKAAMDRLGIVSPIMRAMLLAMIEQESIGRTGPTVLAVKYNNLFGFKDGIKGLPGSVRFGPNQFETQSQEYEIFPSMDRCLQSALYAIFKSKHYEKARREARSRIEGVTRIARGPGETAVHSGWAVQARWAFGWLAAAGPIWAPDNKRHADEVTAKFMRWSDLLLRESQT